MRPGQLSLKSKNALRNRSRIRARGVSTWIARANRCFPFRLCPYVSPEDRYLATGHNWIMHGKPRAVWVWRRSYRSGGKKLNGPIVQLHRVIGERMAGRPLRPNEVIDHINGNPLDNRRENLRITDAAGNVQNRGANRDSKTGYRGICVAVCRKPYGTYYNYMTYLMKNGKQIGSKRFPHTPEGLADAIKYRDEMYEKHGIIKRKEHNPC